MSQTVSTQSDSSTELNTEELTAEQRREIILDTIEDKLGDEKVAYIKSKRIASETSLSTSQVGTNLGIIVEENQDKKRSISIEKFGNSRTWKVTPVSKENTGG